MSDDDSALRIMRTFIDRHSSSKASEGDCVNNPAHYNSHPSGVECVVIAEAFTYNCGNAIKYIWRAGLKGDESKAVEDLRKAAWYCTREADRLEKILLTNRNNAR
jgi:hypothetical protein